MGCESNEDCQTGYFCNRDIAQPRCEDINECTKNNRKFEGLRYCGMNSVCTNTIGSFTCTCNTGYNDFQAYDGCVDIDECKVGGNNCKSNTDCWNTVGSFLCACKIGYTGDPTSKCIDIDECLNPEWNSCGPNEMINLEFCQSSPVIKSLASHNIKDGNQHVYSFLLSSNRNYLIIDIGDSPSQTYSDFTKYRFEIRNSKIKISQCNANDNCNKLRETSIPSEAYILLPYINYYVQFRNVEGKTNIQFGINNKKIIANTADTNEKVDNINMLSLTNLYNTYQCTFLRNFHKVVKSSTCMNTVGSYTCIDDSSEKIGIGFGGHTTSGSTYPSEITVITANKAVCSSHYIDDLGGRLAPGMN